MVVILGVVILWQISANPWFPSDLGSQIFSSCKLTPIDGESKPLRSWKISSNYVLKAGWTSWPCKPINLSCILQAGEISCIWVLQAAKVGQNSCLFGIKSAILAEKARVRVLQTASLALENLQTMTSFSIKLARNPNPSGWPSKL